MSVYLEKCGNASCGRLYEVERFSREFFAGTASSTPACPHCGAVTEGMAGRAYRTRPLAVEYEMWPEPAVTYSGRGRQAVVEAER